MRLNVIFVIALLTIWFVGHADGFSDRNYEINQDYITVKGGELFYKSVGQGVPILVVHGGPDLDQTYLQPQLFEFAESNRMIFYDQRGSGKSLQNFDNLNNITITQFIADIEQLRTELDLGKIILMGILGGGLLSMNYAIRHSQNLLALIF